MAGKPWTKHEDEILRELYKEPTISVYDIGKVLGRSGSSVINRTTVLGLKREYDYKMDEKLLAQLRKVSKF